MEPSELLRKSIRQLVRKRITPPVAAGQHLLDGTYLFCGVDRPGRERLTANGLSPGDGKFAHNCSPSILGLDRKWVAETLASQKVCGSSDPTKNRRIRTARTLRYPQNSQLFRTPRSHGFSRTIFEYADSPASLTALT